VSLKVEATDFFLFTEQEIRHITRQNLFVGLIEASSLSCQAVARRTEPVKAQGLNVYISCCSRIKEFM
jgi:hypothetical protein